MSFHGAYRLDLFCFQGISVQLLTTANRQLAYRVLITNVQGGNIVGCLEASKTDNDWTRTFIQITVKLIQLR